MGVNFRKDLPVGQLSLLGEGNLRAFTKPTALDFFAGSGLATEALKPFFKIVWANDIDPKKANVYRANHRTPEITVTPLEKVSGHFMRPALLSWASFPCQDLSLAGNLRGIGKTRSGLVWEWLRVMDEMRQLPPMVVAENVLGLIGADKGRHYRILHSALVERGYRVGAVLIDAVNWVPQSRRRVFIIGINNEIRTDEWESSEPQWIHPKPIQKLVEGLASWVWWSLPSPRRIRKLLSDIVDPNSPLDDQTKSEHNLSLVPDKHVQRLDHGISNGQWVFSGYKRTRNSRQVLELRFDDLAGCLRTPEGGSSRQLVVINRHGELRTRLLTIEETASLMGVRKSYLIPGSYNDGYKAMGDAVVVPAVRHLARHLLLPIAEKIINRD